jgi:hypothetical protein
LRALIVAKIDDEEAHRKVFAAWRVRALIDEAFAEYAVLAETPGEPRA